MIKDILLKAAEDIQQEGVWCKQEWFQGLELSDYQVVKSKMSLEQAMTTKRCAQGSLAVATALLGGTVDDLHDTYDAIENHLHTTGRVSSLIMFNDHSLPDDPFAAGQQLSELFRAVAESLPIKGEE